jgi:Ras-related GTP-binding protein A/B
MEEGEDNFKKLLILGRHASGKTSMRSIIFANFYAKDTFKNGYTVDVYRSRVRFMGNLVLSLWDCGGQTKFMDQYFESQKPVIFSDVAILIYVFDITSREQSLDLEYFRNSINALQELSPDAKVFCLVNKMDLVIEKKRESTYENKKLKILDLCPGLSITCFNTSIYDESLYKAWSEIVNRIIPNIRLFNERLNDFREALGVDEVILFEKNTFLFVSHQGNSEYMDKERFEKISNIIKQFKLSCIKLNLKICSMTFKTSGFTVFIDEFTKSTFIMVIVADQDFETAVIPFNIRLSKRYFSSLESAKVLTDQ